MTTAKTMNAAGVHAARCDRAGEARAERHPAEVLLEQRVGMAGDRRQDEEGVDHADDRRLDEHRQAPGHRRGALVGVELHRLALEALGVVRVSAAQLGDAGCEACAGALGLRLRDADGMSAARTSNVTSTTAAAALAAPANGSRRSVRVIRTAWAPSSTAAMGGNA
jgi:hypothetical protein